MPRRNRPVVRLEPQLAACQRLEEELRSEWVRVRPQPRWDRVTRRIAA